MRQTLATLATLACARAWPALDEALAAYPGKHAAAVAKLEKGQDAKVVLVGAHHGLGNREHALLSSFALALATDAALFVDLRRSRGQRAAASACTCARRARTGAPATCGPASDKRSRRMRAACLSGPTATRRG